MALTEIKTSGIADDAVTLAKQAGGTDGQIITFDASGNPVAVGPGTDGQVLTSTGAGSPPAFEDTAGGGGKVLQVVSTTKTDYWSQSTSSNSTFYDVTNLSATITPTTSGNKILIFVSLSLGSDQATQRMGARTVVSVGGGSNTVIGQSTETANSVKATTMGNIEMHRVYTIVPTAYQFLYTTSSTSSHIFRPQIVQEPNGTSTIYLNRTEGMDNATHYSSASTITLMEIAQ